MTRNGARRRARLAGLLVVALALAGAARAEADVLVAAVGDMGCASTDPDYRDGAGTATRCRQRAVSDLLVDPLPDAFLALGDVQYDHGELANFRAVYRPTFGRADAVVYPALGNAEYGTPGAQGYFDYYAEAGVSDRIRASGTDTSNYLVGHYYSFDVGDWHLIALNSNCARVPGGCGTGSAQEAWLKRDLDAHPNRCTLAYWHHPRWNSGRLGNDASGAAFWRALYAAGADLVLVGHGNHHYERHRPQDPNGVPDDARGIRQLMAGTGGEALGTPPASPGKTDTLEVADYSSFGILRLTLRERGYDWRFVPAAPGTFTDAGSGTCHAGAVRAPDAPALAALPGDGAVSLSWSSPPDGGASVTGYWIYRSGGAGESLLAEVGATTEYTDRAVTNGTEYTYRVAAVNRVGEGARSAPDSATPTAVPAPAFPAAPELDDFQRPPGALGSSWRSPGLADPGTVTIAEPGRTATSASAGSATWTTALGADQDIALTVPELPGANGFVQLAGRASGLGTANLSCYLLRVTRAGVWELRKKVGGSSSVVLRSFSTPLLAGDTIGLRIIGTKLMAHRRPAGSAWTVVGAAADGDIAAGGYAAFTLGDLTVRGGAFSAGTVPAPAAFPRTGVLDAFGRPAGPLGDAWRSPGLADPGTVRIEAPGLTASSAGAASATWAATAFAPQQESFMTVPTLPRGNGFFQLAGRVSTLGSANLSCYLLRVTPATGTWDLRRKVNGATSISIRTFSAPFAAGDGAGLRLDGSTLTAYRRSGTGDWRPVGTTTDAAIAGSGYVSFTLADTTARAGAFGGGSIGGGGS